MKHINYNPINKCLVYPPEHWYSSQVRHFTSNQDQRSGINPHAEVYSFHISTRCVIKNLQHMQPKQVPYKKPTQGLKKKKTSTATHPLVSVLRESTALGGAGVFSTLRARPPTTQRRGTWAIEKESFPINVSVWHTVDGQSEHKRENEKTKFALKERAVQLRIPERQDAGSGAMRRRRPPRWQQICLLYLCPSQPSRPTHYCSPFASLATHLSSPSLLPPSAGVLGGGRPGSNECSIFSYEHVHLTEERRKYTT